MGKLIVYGFVGFFLVSLISESWSSMEDQPSGRVALAAGGALYALFLFAMYRIEQNKRHRRGRPGSSGPRSVERPPPPLDEEPFP